MRVAFSTSTTLFPFRAGAKHPRICQQSPRSCAVSETRAWIRDVVISLNLCPFAIGPYEKDLIRISVHDDVTGEPALTEVLTAEMNKLMSIPASELETTLVVVPSFSRDDFRRWFDYCSQLKDALAENDDVMVACFHPLHMWGEENERNVSHFECRAPHPTINLLRVATVDRAIDAGYTKNMLERNLETLERVGYDEMVRRFANLSVNS